jgi:thioredoxin 1
MTRRQLLSAALFLVAALGLSNAADAGSIQPFDRATFEAAQRNSQPVLIEISAPWCPVCRAQKPIIEALAGSPDYEGLTVLEVDFDTQKQIVREFGARTQSTLIMFRGKAETGRSVGDTDPARIEALVASGFEG